MPLSIIILAAGKGSRMKSNKPKVIHEVADRPMLQHVVETSQQLQPSQIIVVIGHESLQVVDAMNNQQIIFVEQVEQVGTGHAVLQCHDALTPGNDILVLYGDVPLIKYSTLRKLVEAGKQNHAVCILSFITDEPTGYGRILRDTNQNVSAIIEEKDADETVRKIKECNSGILFIKGSEYKELLMQLDANNHQSEYYLTDVVKHAVAKKQSVVAILSEDEAEVLGVNNQQQLAQIETIYRHRKASELMTRGVKIVDPSRIDVRGELTTGADVVIDVNCVFNGRVELGNNVHIEPNCVLTNCKIGDHTIVHAMSVIESSSIGDYNDIGPYARVRPDTITGSEAKIGNFVEVKKSIIGNKSKVNHLTYIGDCEMGSGVNIGAGTITCNYDGAYKHKTIIEDDVFVGSDTQLVAPVRVTRNTTIGAGSTITKDTPEGQLTFSRARQVSFSNWVRPTKNK